MVSAKGLLARCVCVACALAACGMMSGAGATETNFKVVIDAGHGGKDSGALGVKLGTKEKDVNLKVAKSVGRMLQNAGGYEVVYTRSTDVFVTLDERPKIANKAKADLFVSIHSNATENKSINGFETYTLGESRNDVSVRENKVAELEENYKNKYDFGSDSDEGFIYSNMMLDAGSGGEMSIRMAQMVQGRLKENTDRVDRDVRQANFWVLKHILMPGVLVEIGYLSNMLEEAFLVREENQENIARSIFEAIEQYKEELRRKSATLTDEEAAEQEVKEQKDGAKDGKVGTNDGKASAKDAKTGTNNGKAGAKDAKAGVKDEKSEAKKADAAKTGEKAKEDIYYRIQLFSIDRKLPPNSPMFKKQTPAFEYKEGNTYKYMYGLEQNFQNAQMLKQKVKMDFPDAFVVVFDGDRRLTGADAAKYYK